MKAPDELLKRADAVIAWFQTMAPQEGKDYAHDKHQCIADMLKIIHDFRALHRYTC